MRIPIAKRIPSLGNGTARLYDEEEVECAGDVTAAWASVLSPEPTFDLSGTSS
jgi:hypothetical protein